MLRSSIPNKDNPVWRPAESTARRDALTITRVAFGFKNLRSLLEKYPTLFFLQKPGGFQWSTLAWDDLEPSYISVNFVSPIHSVSSKQHLSEVMFSALVGFSLWEKVSNLRAGKKGHTRRARSRREFGFSPKKKKVWMNCKECAGGLSWCRCQLPVDHNYGLLCRTASHRRWSSSTLWWLFEPVLFCSRYFLRISHTN